MIADRELANTLYILVSERENVLGNNGAHGGDDAPVAGGDESDQANVGRKLIEGAQGQGHVERRGERGFHTA